MLEVTPVMFPIRFPSRKSIYLLIIYLFLIVGMFNNKKVRTYYTIKGFEWFTLEF